VGKKVEATTNKSRS